MTTALVFIYALIKLQYMIEGKNPTINTNAETIEEGEKYVIAEEDFMVAFAIDHFLTGVKTDEHYI